MADSSYATRRGRPKSGPNIQGVNMSSIKTPGITHRQHNQHARIAQGIQSGELTRPEARALIKEQREIRQAKVEARSDGQVTKEERQAIRQMLNDASHDIFELKHNDRERPNKFV